MTRSFLLLPLLLATTGCVEIPLALLLAESLNDDGSAAYEGYDDSYSYEDEYDDLYTPTDSFGVEGEMAGVMPANGPFERPVSDGEARWYQDGSLELDVHATGDQWAMIAMAFDPWTLEPGVTQHYGPGEIPLIGCSGPVPFDYAFDDAAEAAEITVEPIEVDGRGQLQISVWADFGEGREVTTVVVVPEPGDDSAG